MPRKLVERTPVPAPANPTPQPDGYEFAMIETTRLLRPKIPSRETFDESALADLVESVTACGRILEPLLVRPEGDLYRVAAGDRRLAVARALSLPRVPCMIMTDDLPSETVTEHENGPREPVNPAEQARYYHRLLTEVCANDMDKLCALIRKGRSYVDGRLVLMKGDPDVFSALADNAIPIGVAYELNKVTDASHRTMLLDVCVTQGAGVRQAREWRIQDNLMTADAPYAAPEFTHEGVIDRPPVITTMNCLFCGESDDAWDMELLYVHRRCRRIKDREAAADVRRMEGEGWHHA
jgi:ParB family transcriptional regulator, chromosome partitioning protein